MKFESARVCQHSLGHVLVTALSIVLPWLPPAVLAFDESFDGNSGGVPENWSLFALSDDRSGTDVSEGSGSVSITDVQLNSIPGLPVYIDSPSFDPFPPGATQATFSFTIDSISNTGSGNDIASVLLGQFNVGLQFELDDTSNTFSIYGYSFAPTEQLIAATGSPFAFPYSGGSVTFTVTLDTDSFRVVSTTNSFDSGDILFSSFGISSFSDIHDLGPVVYTSIGSSKMNGDGSTTSTFSHVDYEVDGTRNTIGLDDSFDGGGGSVPSGWNLWRGSDTGTGTDVSTSNGAVTITDTSPSGQQDTGAVIIDSPAVHPTLGGASATKLTVDIAALQLNQSQNSYAGISFGNERFSILLEIGGNGIITIEALEVSNNYDSTEASGSPFNFVIPSGAFQIVIEIDSTGFQITCPENGFNSGRILFASFGVTTVTHLTDLNDAVFVSLLTQTNNANGDSAVMTVDRVLYEDNTNSPPPAQAAEEVARAAQVAQATTQVKKIQRQLKKAKKSRNRNKLKKLKKKLKAAKKRLSSL